jgi:hypothetical protein
MPVENIDKSINKKHIQTPNKGKSSTGALTKSTNLTKSERSSSEATTKSTKSTNYDFFITPDRNLIDNVDNVDNDPLSGNRASLHSGPPGNSFLESSTKETNLTKEGVDGESTPLETILQALIAAGTWRTTRQIATAAKMTEQETLSTLEGLYADGTAERDGGPIFIWKAVTASTDKIPSLDTSNLETRLLDYGISIAIDRATGSALLLFTRGDRETVRHVADVYEPFEVQLTPVQRSELTVDMDRYENILRKKEWIEERAGILELEAGMSREAANVRAAELWFRREEKQ